MRGAIKLINAERRALKELQDTAKTKPAPLTGMDMLTVLFNRGFSAEKQIAIEMVYRLIDEIKEKIARGESPFTEKTPRILLTGLRGRSCADPGSGRDEGR